MGHEIFPRRTLIKSTTKCGEHMEVLVATMVVLCCLGYLIGGYDVLPVLPFWSFALRQHRYDAYSEQLQAPCAETSFSL